MEKPVKTLKVKKEKQKEEMIVVRKITYLRIFIVVMLLMTTDVISSFIVTQHPEIFEVNSLAARFFSYGTTGLFLWLILCSFLLSFSILFLYLVEEAFFKYSRQQFRMKFLYLILGVYTFVFSRNLQVFISVYLSG